MSTNKHWPVEKDSLCKPSVNDDPVPELSSTFSSNVFDEAKRFRYLLLRAVQPLVLDRFDGEGYMTIWPTKSCSVGCDFCFFNSAVAKVGDPKNTLTVNGIDKALCLIHDANVKRLMVSGGGEPFLVYDPAVKKILEFAEVSSILLATSGNWAKRAGKAKSTISSIAELREKNAQRPLVNLRISLDSYHTKKISPENDLGYLINIVDAFSRGHKRWQGFALGFRTLYGDPVVEAFLSKLTIVSRNIINARNEEIVLDSGFSFILNANSEFDCNQYVDLHDEAFVAKQISLWDENIATIYGGNTSVVRFGDKKGLNLELLHDGDYFPWGGASPDNESSIYADDYASFMRKTLGDVISLSFLEKGNAYRDAIVSEVNPRAVAKGKAMGLRDFYPRVIFEEEKTMLYYAIRATQDFIKEGRVENIPETVRRTLSLSKEDLISLYASSDNDIARQRLGECTSLDDLLRVYGNVVRGHYEVGAGKITGLIANSTVLSDELKSSFFLAIGRSPR
ncbi:MAG: radical SAM protein [Sulfuricellaceae bacterium]